MTVQQIRIENGYEAYFAFKLLITVLFHVKFEVIFFPGSILAKITLERSFIRLILTGPFVFHYLKFKVDTISVFNDKFEILLVNSPFYVLLNNEILTVLVSNIFHCTVLQRSDTAISEYVAAKRVLMPET